jgi:hypothetical protein
VTPSDVKGLGEIEGKLLTFLWQPAREYAVKHSDKDRFRPEMVAVARRGDPIQSVNGGGRSPERINGTGALLEPDLTRDSGHGQVAVSAFSYMDSDVV